MRGSLPPAHSIFVADEQADSFANELDQLEHFLAHKDAEIQRLRTELALKTLYVEELQAALEAQARELEAFDIRLRRMESRVVKSAPSLPPASEIVTTVSSARPAPLLIRIRKAMRK